MVSTTPSSACLRLKNQKSDLEALALKQSLVECGTMTRWCHSAAQLVTKDSDATCAPGFRWKLIHDHKFESSRKRAERGLEIWAELDEDECAADIPRDPQRVTLITLNARLVSSHNLVSCTRVLDFASTNDPVHRDASVLVLCLLMRYSEFVVGFVKILTEVGEFGEI